MPVSVWLSAHTGEGVELLFEALAECLGHKMVCATLQLPIVVPADLSKLRAELYSANALENETYDDNGCSQLQIVIPQVELLKILGREGISADDLEWVGDAPILSTTEDWEKT